MRKATLHNAGTKGVLDARLRERIDLTHYWNGFRVARNTTVRQLGGWMRRPGTTFAPGLDIVAAGTHRRLRRRLEPINVTAGMVTVANGGTASKLVGQDAASGDDFVTNAVGAATFVLAEIDLGAAIDLAFVDVSDFKCATSGADDALAVEYYDGANWLAFGDRQNIRSSARRTRRFGFQPGGPGGVPVSTRHIRFVLYGASGTGAFTISRVRLWKEKRMLSPDRLIMFARAADTKYELVLTDRNIDVFKDHRWVAAIPVPIDARQVRRMTWAQSLDTLHLYHEDVWTRVVQRQGSDNEWNDTGIVFTNAPTLSAATAFSGDTNEVQSVSLAGIVNGQSFVLWVDDEVTAPIAFSGTGSLAADIASALAALPAFASTSPSVVLTDATTRTVQITFAGSLGARRWAPAFAVVLGDDVLDPTVKVLQRGIDADGVFASKQTGWPRCGVFEQSRHRMGGFRSAPLSVVSSRAGSPYDLQTTASPVTADLGFVDTLESDQNETIYRLFVGKHTQAMTESGVWFQSVPQLDATTARGWKLAARPGVEASVPVVFLDDATLYMQSGERKPGAGEGPARVMRELVLVSAVEAQYVADPKNVLAPDLITRAIDFAVREPRKSDEPAMGLTVNEDGTIAHLATQRAQEVIGFFPWDTDGKFRSVGVDINANMWAIVERSTEADGADLYLERFDADTVLDATVTYEFTEPTSTLTGLKHLAGKADVWAYVDGDLWGPLTVSAGGVCELDVAGIDVSIGLKSEWRSAPMPLRDKLNERQPFRPPGRIYEMGITVQSTGPIDLSVNGGPAREVPVTYLGDKQYDGGPFQTGGEMDLPLLERLFSGTITMQNLRGWSKHPTWELSQSKPAPVEIIAVRTELAFRG
ncbi:protein of unknown function [Hyphomicrobium sp. 1Nfss2.1]|uniref:hypothetical protein n=1 Tax=Hyphomicrobium sp. 1Nfss2.1 TaxID=3413936 RepID=UPI003C7DB501